MAHFVPTATASGCFLHTHTADKIFEVIDIIYFFIDFSFNTFQTFARFLHWFITCLNVFVVSFFHKMTVNTFYRHSIYTMKKGDNFGFLMRGKYQFILIFVVGTHVFAKCLQKQGGIAEVLLLKTRSQSHCSAKMVQEYLDRRERDGALPSKEAKLEPSGQISTSFSHFTLFTRK